MIVDLPDTSTRDVSKKLVQLRESGGANTLGRVLTLVVSAAEGEPTESAIDAANEASREHPCRVIVVARGPRTEPTRLDAQIRVGGDAGASEVVVLRLYGPMADHGASVVIPFLLPDTPVAAWWPGAAPTVPAEDPIGRLASRRITDSLSALDGRAALADRLAGYRPGDSDLVWSRITPWRALLAAALDQPPYLAVSRARVTGTHGSASADLLAGWLRSELKVPVRRAVGSFEVQLDRADGPVQLQLDQTGIAVIARPGKPDGKVAVFPRRMPECLAEELRRLDGDVIYKRALTGALEVEMSG